MTRSSISSILLVGILALTLFGGWYVSSNYYSTEGQLGDVVAHKGPPLNIEGLVFSDYQGGLLSSRIEVQKLYVRPIKFAGFRVKSLNELSLEGVKFVFHRSVESAEQRENKQMEPAIGTKFSSSIKGLVKMKRLGRVVRGNINHLNMSFVEGENVYFSLQSARAFFWLRDRKKINFENVNFFRPENKIRISTKKAHWDEAAHLFVVPGRYSYISPAGVSSGENIAFDLDFKIRRF